MTKKILLFFFVNLLLLSACAQIGVVTYDNVKHKAKDFFDDGNKAYAFGKYQEADSLLKLSVKQEKNFIDAHWLLAMIYLENNRNYDLSLIHI